METNKIRIERKWAMPSSATFKIKPIAELLKRYIQGDWIDPFAGNNSPAVITNDLNPAKPTKYHLEAKEFIERMKSAKFMFDGGLFDPPYSLRQIVECYEGIGLVPDKKWATTKFYTDVKNGLSEIIKPDGLCISFGWNTIGLGKKRGFEIIEILIVSHGRLHNDTLVTVEKRLNFTPTPLF